MSTAATAAYQAAQVESGIWLSESSAPGTAPGKEARRGEGTAPKHPCVYVRSLARFPHPSGERVYVSPRVFAPSRKTPRDPRVFPRSSCASVIMCSHIGVPERGVPRATSPVDLEVDRTSCIYVRAWIRADVCVKRAYMPTAVIRENK